MRVWSAGSCGKRADSLPPRPGHGVLPVNTGGCPPDEARCRMPRPDSVLLLTFLRKPTGSQTIDFPSRLRDLRVRLYRYHTPKTHAKPRRTRSSGATDSSLQRRTSHIAHYRCQNVRSIGTGPRLTQAVDRGGNHLKGWGPGRGSPRAERALLLPMGAKAVRGPDLLHSTCIEHPDFSSVWPLAASSSFRVQPVVAHAPPPPLQPCILWRLRQ